jgi:hypothetical protein
MTTIDSHEDDAPAPAARGRYRRLARTVAPIAAALLVGAGVAFAVEHHSSSSGSAGSASSAAGTPDAGATGGGPGGGIAGEQHIQGTVTATTSGSITVKSSSGSSTTYVVNSTTEIVRNGQSASLAAVKVGDPVFLHVYPSSSGQMLVERLFAGTSSTDTGPGFGPPPSSGGSPGTSSVPATHI